MCPRYDFSVPRGSNISYGREDELNKFIYSEYRISKLNHSQNGGELTHLNYDALLRNPYSEEFKKLAAEIEYYDDWVWFNTVTLPTMMKKLEELFEKDGVEFKKYYIVRFISSGDEDMAVLDELDPMEHGDIKKMMYDLHKEYNILQDLHIQRYQIKIDHQINTLNLHLDHLNRMAEHVDKKIKDLPPEASAEERESLTKLYESIQTKISRVSDITSDFILYKDSGDYSDINAFNKIIDAVEDVYKETDIKGMFEQVYGKEGSQKILDEFNNAKMNLATETSVKLDQNLQKISASQERLSELKNTLFKEMGIKNEPDKNTFKPVDHDLILKVIEQEKKSDQSHQNDPPNPTRSNGK